MKSNDHRPITILIVEDSLLTRIGILSLCPWDECGFQIIDHVESGQKALEIILEKTPDIVLTDIKMPGMSGLDLLREVRQQNLSTQFIVFSAHNEFPLVREALQLGAKNYLLKMELNAEVLLSACQAVAQEILDAETASGDSDSQSSISSSAADQLITDMLGDRFFTPEEYRKNLTLLGMPEAPGQLYCIVGSRTDASRIFDDRNSAMLQKTILNVMCDLLSSSGTAIGVVLPQELFVILLYADATEESACIKLQQMLQTGLVQSTRRIFDINLVVRSAPVPAPEQLPGIYRTLLTQLSQEKDQLSAPLLSNPLGTQLSQLEHILTTLDMESLESGFDNLIASIQNNRDVSNKHLYGVCHTLIHLVDRFVSKNPYLAVPWNRSDELLAIAKCSRSTEEHLDWICSIKERLLQAISSDGNSNRMILQAKKYIEEHYNEDISLENVSNQIGVTPVYFCRLFVKKTGRNFIDYLTEIRINHAKHFLHNTPLRIREISERVGYNDPYYFSRIFKKSTGLTPVEFRGKEKE